jgi:DNA repair exonuclease SbcCD nuclease subunit
LYHDENNVKCLVLKEIRGNAPVVLIAGNHDLLENNKDRMIH